MTGKFIDDAPTAGPVAKPVPRDPGSEGWQPIETAPKDGTYIIVARRGEDIGAAPMEITNWFSIENSHYEEIENGLYRKVSDKPISCWNGNGHRATHWMPLPAPPRVSQ